MKFSSVAILSASLAIASPTPTSKAIKPTTPELPQIMIDGYGAARVYMNGTLDVKPLEDANANIIADGSCKSQAIPMLYSSSFCATFSRYGSALANEVKGSVLKKFFGSSDAKTREFVAGRFDEIAKECSTNDRGYLKTSCAAPECDSGQLIFYLKRDHKGIETVQCPLFWSVYNFFGPYYPGAPTFFDQGTVQMLAAALVPQGANLEFDRESPLTFVYNYIAFVTEHIARPPTQEE